MTSEAFEDSDFDVEAEFKAVSNSETTTIEVDGQEYELELSNESLAITNLTSYFMNTGDEEIDDSSRFVISFFHGMLTAGDNDIGPGEAEKSKDVVASYIEEHGTEDLEQIIDDMLAIEVDS